MELDPNPQSRGNSSWVLTSIAIVSFKNEVFSSLAALSSFFNQFAFSVSDVEIILSSGTENKISNQHCLSKVQLFHDNIGLSL